jgi:hypothetical protein
VLSVLREKKVLNQLRQHRWMLKRMIKEDFIHFIHSLVSVAAALPQTTDDDFRVLEIVVQI